MSESYGWKELEAGVRRVLATETGHRQVIEGVRPLLQRLLAKPDLLPEEYQVPLPNKYAQYLLYKPEDESFSVIAFVWGAGQTAPVHDHLVWGLVGLYRGAVLEKRYKRIDLGETEEPRYRLQEVSQVVAKTGDISFVYPPDYDIHGVSNPFDEKAITIHIYGTDIGKQSRHIHDPETGRTRDIVTKHDNFAPLYAS